MKRHRKAGAINTGGIINFEHGPQTKSLLRREPIHMKDTINQTKNQFKSPPQKKPIKLASSLFFQKTAFVCDTCALPLNLYGENFIESYHNGKVNTLRCLCDIHAAEMGLVVSQ